MERGNLNKQQGSKNKIFLENDQESFDDKMCRNSLD